MYSAEEAAELLPGKTAHWLLKNARLRKIAHTRVGRTIMFSAEDVAEIVRAGKVQPDLRAVPPSGAPPRVSAARSAKEPKLTARTPRRKRGAA
jgi:hypothetical protein